MNEQIRNPVIALLTDFGTSDGYVGAMKGRILSETSGNVQIVDISHDIPPFNVQHGMFTLMNSYPNFPEGTVFIAVVDPGVGSTRYGLVIKTPRYIFVGPDNGIFSPIFIRESTVCYRIIRNKLPWKVGSTFHGRDIFAPLGAKLSQGDNLDSYFYETTDYVKILQEPVLQSPTCISASLMHIDQFGNCILNVTQSDLPLSTGHISVSGTGFQLTKLVKTFADVKVGEALLNWDSNGYLQIAVNQGSAARMFHLSIGDICKIRLEPDSESEEGWIS